MDCILILVLIKLNPASATMMVSFMCQRGCPAVQSDAHGGVAGKLFCRCDDSPWSADFQKGRLFWTTCVGLSQSVGKPLAQSPSFPGEEVLRVPATCSCPSWRPALQILVFSRQPHHRQANSLQSICYLFPTGFASRVG